MQNSDSAVLYVAGMRHVKGAGARHIVELFLQSYPDGAI
jgi:hypothetical protein